MACRVPSCVLALEPRVESQVCEVMSVLTDIHSQGQAGVIVCGVRVGGGVEKHFLHSSVTRTMWHCPEKLLALCC